MVAQVIIVILLILVTLYAYADEMYNASEVEVQDHDDRSVETYVE